MRIGYSAWGFCGDGLKDSPDGGRLTRSLFIEHLILNGHEIVWLQENRDLDHSGKPIFCEENAANLSGQRQTLCRMKYDVRFPDIDVLFLEWRWPIAGRNVVSKNAPGYTPDLDRQLELLNHYTRCHHRPRIMIWDKDETMTREDEIHLLRHRCHDFPSSPVVIMSPALNPRDIIMKRQTLLFPCDLSKIRGTKVNESYDSLIGYVGSQYDRDEQVYRYINPFATTMRKESIPGITDPVVFVGNWTKGAEKLARNTSNFPDITFKDRVLPSEMGSIYRRCLSTVLLCKSNYSRHGHITQRIHEVASHGVIAIGLTEQFGIENFVENTITDAHDLLGCVKDLMSMNVEERQAILDRNIDRLEPFDIHHVISKFEEILRHG